MNNTHWRVKNEDLPIEHHQQYLHQQLPKELGTGYSDSFQLDTGLNYIETHYIPNKKLSIISQIDTQEPRMVITLGLKGQSAFTDNKGTELNFNAGYTSIATFSTSTGERHYQAHHPIKQLRLSITKTWLERYVGEEQTTTLFNNKNLKLHHHQPISAPARLAAQQLLTHTIHPELKRVFMHAQVLNLLVAELSHLYQQKTKFTEKDQAIALIARDILSQNYQNPPSVEQLARRAGTNTFKLKQLFHHFFNNTPYGVLLDIRMNKAYELLNTKRYQVSIVAELVGYNHASNFSIAFNKYFGISPKQLAKR